MKTTHFCVLIHCLADCWLCLKQFAPGICPSQTIGLKTIEKISITKEICMTIDSSPKKIPGRKTDSEAGCIFENLTPKQDNSLKILAAGARNHGVSLPTPPGISVFQRQLYCWMQNCFSACILFIIQATSKSDGKLVSALQFLQGIMGSPEHLQLSRVPTII